MKETELKLVVVSEEPDTAAAQVASISSVPGYRLVEAGRHSLHDTYFDSPDRALSRQGWALRLRHEDHQQLITLKGPSRSVSGRAPSRFEFEAPWSPDALRRVWQMLASQGLVQSPASTEPTIESPRLSMESLGLVLLTDRRTERRLKQAWDDSTETHVADLMFDRVTYMTGTRPLRHHEVEIEALDEKTSDAVLRLGEELSRVFGPVLRRYEHSKLAIGLALRILERDGRLKGLTDTGGNLLPPAYEAINEALRMNRATN